MSDTATTVAPARAGHTVHDTNVLGTRGVHRAVPHA